MPDSGMTCKGIPMSARDMTTLSLSIIMIIIFMTIILGIIIIVIHEYEDGAKRCYEFW